MSFALRIVGHEVAGPAPTRSQKRARPLRFERPPTVASLAPDGTMKRRGFRTFSAQGGRSMNNDRREQIRQTLRQLAAAHVAAMELMERAIALLNEELSL